MKKFRVWCPSHALYLIDCDPETKKLNLTTERKKAPVFFQIDADLYKSTAYDLTGLTFELEIC